MDIYYINNGTNPNILTAVYNRDRFTWQNTIQATCSVIAIDELDPANKTLCMDLAATQSKRDANGLMKYYIDSTGALTEAANWQEAVNG